jgi:protein gp37
MNRTGISYADLTWNPMIGCSRVSPGCEHCYAERLASTRLRHMPAYAVVTNKRGWNGKIHLMPKRLDEPIRRRKPARIFLGDMSDLFHPEVPFEFIAACFGVMAACPQHVFLLLSKRPQRMLDVLTNPRFYEAVLEAARPIRIARPSTGLIGISNPANIPAKNIHLGVTCEDQQRADERIPLLLRCPAAVRWVSAEPLLGPIDFDAWIGAEACMTDTGWGKAPPWLDQIIPGGESGPHARPCDVEWIRSIVRQCRASRVACFVKQLGSNPVGRDWMSWVKTGFHWPVEWKCMIDDRVVASAWENGTWHTWDQNGFGGENSSEPTLEAAKREAEASAIKQGFARKKLKNRHGADPSEWPEDLRVREFPKL